MMWTDILQLLVTLASAVAAILAWVAKLRWSEEYAKAKDETIRAKGAQIELLERQVIENAKEKDAQIEALKQRIEGLHELNSPKIREHYLSMKEQLEEHIHQLETDITSRKREIEEKEKEITLLNDSGKKNMSLIHELVAKRGNLENEIILLKNELENQHKSMGKLEIEIDTLLVVIKRYDNLFGFLQDVSKEKLLNMNRNELFFLINQVLMRLTQKMYSFENDGKLLIQMQKDYHELSDIVFRIRLMG